MFNFFVSLNQKALLVKARSGVFLHRDWDFPNLPFNHGVQLLGVHPQFGCLGDWLSSSIVNTFTGIKNTRVVFSSYGRKARRFYTLTVFTMTNNNNANSDWKTKLEQLEEEIRKATSANQSNQQSTDNSYPYVEMDSETYFTKRVEAWMEMTRDWFNALSKPGKVIVGISAVWLGFFCSQYGFFI